MYPYSQACSRRSPSRQIRDPYDDHQHRFTRPEDYGYEDQRRSYSPRRRGLGGVPLITLNEPRENYQRRSLPPEERTGPYGSFLRDSMTPPPRISRRRVPSFADTFGDVPRQAGRSGERLQYDPYGPDNPYAGGGGQRRHMLSRPTTPFGGYPQPHNPFSPGGGVYNDQIRGRPLNFGDDRFDEGERRRRSYYRSNLAEPWGVASYAEYETRRYNEERMHRLDGGGR